MSATDEKFMRFALRLARRGHGTTSPNPTVGAVLVRGEKVIGRGRTSPPGGPHAEIRALGDARKRGHDPRGATLYVTLEPCCTHGRTPPCTDAIVTAGIQRVVVGATDPNPKHRGRGFRILRRAGLDVSVGVLSDECVRLNEAFNHWIVRRSPFVTVKAAMTLDGKIATAKGESKWITGEKSREFGMSLRQGSDAILIGINTVLADDPSLTVRNKRSVRQPTSTNQLPGLRRIVLDSLARTPLTARVVSDEFMELTTIVVTNRASRKRIAALAKRVNVLVAPSIKSTGREARPVVDLRWLLRKLGAENVTSLLVEGGGEVNGSFLFGGLVKRVAFFYAPQILGGRDARKGVAGDGVTQLSNSLKLTDVGWRKLGPDLVLTARVSNRDD